MERQCYKREQSGDKKKKIRESIRRKRENKRPYLWKRLYVAVGMRPLRWESH